MLDYKCSMSFNRFFVVNWFLKAPKKGHKCNYCSNESHCKFFAKDVLLFHMCMCCVFIADSGDVNRANRLEIQTNEIKTQAKQWGNCKRNKKKWQKEKANVRKTEKRRVKLKLKQSCGSIKSDQETHAKANRQQQENAQFTTETRFDLYIVHLKWFIRNSIRPFYMNALKRRPDSVPDGLLDLPIRCEVTCAMPAQNWFSGQISMKLNKARGTSGYKMRLQIGNRLECCN